MSISHHFKKMNPKRLVDLRDEKKVIINFAETHGFVYFGYVNQRSDEHRLVRGMTLSPTHIDNDYCIGTYSDYDCVMLRRSDRVFMQDRSVREISWLITAVDLRTRADLPPIFLANRSRLEVFLAKNMHLTAIGLGAFAKPDPEFTKEFYIYSSPSYAQSVDQFLTPVLQQSISKYFDGMSIEISGGVVYVYSLNSKISADKLEQNLQCAVWLAQTIDSLYYS